MELNGTAAFVTGAASGLGAATAHALDRMGIAVWGIDLAQNLASLTEPSGIRLMAADVTDANQVEQALSAVEAPLRLVVNCAGIAPARRILSRNGPHDLAAFQRTIDVNLVGTFNVMRLAAAVMSQTDPDDTGQRGLIVNTASVAAFEGQIGQVAYAASKGGVVAMTIAAARDLARTGIRVNTIAPGIVETPMLASLGAEVAASLSSTVPFPHRLGRPDEFAELVLMLAGHDYINGETIRMDGALRMAAQ